MSSGWLSGQVTVMMYSARRSTSPVIISGRIRAKAMNTMMAKPIRTFKRMSVNGTNVPSSLPSKRLSSRNIGHRRLEGGHDIDLGQLGGGPEEVGDRLVEEV